MRSGGAGARAFALGLGLVTHATFLVAVAGMALALVGGMDVGHGHAHGGVAVVGDALLALQFPVLHSLFLGRRGGGWLVRLVPGGMGRELATTTYALFAALQILVTFQLWSPTGWVLWQPTGAWYGAWMVVYASSWLVLGKAMVDARLSVQTGFLGWSSVWRGRRVEYGSFPREGMFRLCRQPVYFAFALILWTGPVWTVDHLALAVVWTGYCVWGPRLKERRYLARYGEEFARYREGVAYWVPSARRRTA